MGDFNSMFPNFLTQCLSLKTLLTPIAYLLITGGLIASTIAHHRSGNASLQAVGKVIVLIMLIVFLPNWGNQIVTIVSDTVTNTLQVDPAKIHDQYQAALQMKKSTDGNTSWWEKLINFPSIMEALVSGVFMILGWFASAIEWWAYILQTAILFIGYSLSPIFIGMLAFPSLQNVGRSYGKLRRFRFIQRRCLCGPGGGNGWCDHICRWWRSRNQKRHCCRCDGHSRRDRVIGDIFDERRTRRRRLVIRFARANQ